MSNTTRKNPIVLWLGLTGIISVFLAAFSGVYFATTLDKRERDRQERKTYLAYLTGMCEECKETVDLNKGIDPESGVRKIRGGPLLLNAGAQSINHLILMDDNRLVDFIRLITRVGYHETRYHDLLIHSFRDVEIRKQAEELFNFAKQ